MGIFVEARTFVPTKNTKNIVMFGNSYTGQFKQYRDDGAGGLASRDIWKAPDPVFSWGVWMDVDLSWLGLPADVCAIDIGTPLVVTGAADLTLAFRSAPGDLRVVSWQNYGEQCLEASASDGQRGQAMDTIPCENCKFQVAIMAKTYPGQSLLTISTTPAVGWQFELKKYFRPLPL